MGVLLDRLIYEVSYTIPADLDILQIDVKVTYAAKDSTLVEDLGKNRETMGAATIVQHIVSVDTSTNTTVIEMYFYDAAN